MPNNPLKQNISLKLPIMHAFQVYTGSFFLLKFTSKIKLPIKFLTKHRTYIRKSIDNTEQMFYNSHHKRNKIYPGYMQAIVGSKNNLSQI